MGALLSFLRPPVTSAKSGLLRDRVSCLGQQVGPLYSPVLSEGDLEALRYPRESPPVQRGFLVPARCLASGMPSAHSWLYSVSGQCASPCAVRIPRRNAVPGQVCPHGAPAGVAPEQAKRSAHNQDHYRPPSLCP